MKILTMGSLVFLFSCFSSQAAILSLEEFLNQVEKNNASVMASHLISVGSLERAKDGELLLAPTFFSSYNYLLYKQETPNPPFQGTSTRADAYSFGFSKLTDFGLTAKLSYTLTHTDIEQASLIPVPDYYTAAPQLNLSFSFSLQYQNYSCYNRQP